MDHGALLLVELGGVVLGLAILARLATRLAVSPIPLYLLAGLALGEGGLGSLARRSRSSWLPADADTS